MTIDKEPSANEDKHGNWLSTIIEGGLPQVLAGPAGKAISRLIGASADIPAAWIEGIAQGHRDKTSARTTVSNAIAEKAAGLAGEDQDLIERALNGMIAASYRKQENRDAVAAVALEDLSRAPPLESSEGPDEDWMNKFERHAEDASSEDLRTIFGKILAGEIRAPGSISPSTLQFVSMMDREVANLINQVLPACSIIGYAFMDMLPWLTFEQKTLLEQAGLWTFDDNMKVKITPDTSRTANIIVRPTSAIQIVTKSNEVIDLRGAILSKAGKDLVGAADVDFDVSLFCPIARETGKVVSAVGASCFRVADGWKIANVSTTIRQISRKPENG